MIKMIASYIDLAIGLNYAFFKFALVPENEVDFIYMSNFKRLSPTGYFFSDNLDPDYTLCGFGAFCRSNGGKEFYAEHISFRTKIIEHCEPY